MRRLARSLWVLVVLAAWASPQAVPQGPSLPLPPARQQDVVPDFRLIDERDEGFELYRQGRARAVVLVAHGVGCPILQKSVPALHALQRRYAPQGVVFRLLNASDTRAEVAAEARGFGLEIPILCDDAQLVSRDLGLTRTAEAVVLVPGRWKVAYRGAVDDRFDYEGHRRTAGHAWLADALDAVLAGQPPSQPVTVAKGCLIAYHPPSALSFEHAIRPLIMQKCTTCHRHGVLPPDLSTLERWRRAAPTIRETLLTQRMPSWNVDPAYGHFKEHLQLTPAERQLLVAWLDQGLPASEPVGPLLCESPTPAPYLKPPDLRWRMPTQHVQPSVEPPWRYFQIAGPFAEDRWISHTGLPVFDRRLQLHAKLLVSTKPLAELEQLLGLRAGADSRISLEDSAWVSVLWSTSRYNYLLRWPPVDGCAFHVPKGSYLIFESHLGITGRPETCDLGLALWWYRGERPPCAYRRVLVENRSFTIPPGVERCEVQASKVLERDVLALTITMHMHQRGERIRLVAEYPDHTREVLASKPFYAAEGQQTARFAEPRLLPAGTRLLADATYNNAASNPHNPDPQVAVPAGTHSERNEMLLTALTVIEVDPASISALPLRLRQIYERDCNLHRAPRATGRSRVGAARGGP